MSDCMVRIHEKARIVSIKASLFEAFSEMRERLGICFIVCVCASTNHELSHLFPLYENNGTFVEGKTKKVA